MRMDDCMDSERTMVEWELELLKMDDSSLYIGQYMVPWAIIILCTLDSEYIMYTG